MKKLSALLVLSICAFLVSCLVIENSSSSGGGPGSTTDEVEEQTGTVAGSLVFILASGHGGYASGYINIFVNEKAHRISAGDGEIDKLNNTLTVNYSVDKVAPGRKSIFYTASITTESETRNYSGYTVIPLSAGERQSPDPFDFYLLETGTSDGMAGKPVITLDPLEKQPRSPVYPLSASLNNMDLPLVFVFINGNCFPASVDLSSSGTADMEKTVTLDAGKNEIRLMAANYNGEVAVTEPAVIDFAVIRGGITSTMMGTLVWDTPTSDVDLHCFYYQDPEPDLAAAPYYHIAYWNMDFPDHLPSMTLERADFLMAGRTFPEYSIYMDSVWNSAELSEAHGRQMRLYRNLDFDEVEGLGPEHITFKNFKDGYYIFALNSFSLDQDDHANCVFTLKTGKQEQSVSHQFSISNSQSYDSDMDAWARLVDVVVKDGEVTLLEPDARFLYQKDFSFSGPDAFEPDDVPERAKDARYSMYFDIYRNILASEADWASFRSADSGTYHVSVDVHETAEGCGSMALLLLDSALQDTIQLDTGCTLSASLPAHTFFFLKAESFGFEGLYKLQVWDSSGVFRKRTAQNNLKQ